MNPRRIRWRLVMAFSLGAVLLSAAPAGAYNEENVKHIRMSRLDPIACAVPIRIVADLRDRSGNPVAGAEVNFSYKRSAPGDTIAPTTVFSDARGLAQTTIQLTCRIGSRIIRASVPGDGSAQLVVTCSPRIGCTIKPHAGTVGMGGLPDTRSHISAGGHLDQQVLGSPFRDLARLVVAGAIWVGRVLVASGI
jgi:hypothetical protein